MMEQSSRVACAHASVKYEISAMNLGEYYGILACLLNDGMCGHLDATFVGWVLTIFVIPSFDVSFRHGLPFPLPLPSSYYWY